MCYYFFAERREMKGESDLWKRKQIQSIRLVEAVNKKLDEIERMIYRKKIIVVWFIESFLAIFALILKHYEVSICIFMADIVLCVSILLGNIEIKRIKKKMPK